MANNPNSGLETHPSGGGAALNAIINANWVSLESWINPAQGITASQTATTLTASADVFTADDVGATVRFADGTTDTIAGYTSPTVVTMTTSQAVSSQAFQLYRTDANKRDALARGMTKRARMTASDTGKVPVWNNTLSRFVMTNAPGTSGSSGAVASLGAGTALTMSFAPLAWASTNAQVTLPAGALFLIIAQVRLEETSAAPIDVELKLRNVTDGVDLSQVAKQSIPASGYGTVTLVALGSSTDGGDTIQIFGLASAGSAVEPGATSIQFIRLA